MKKKIIQVTIHLGGGVGKAIIGVAKQVNELYETEIIVLEQPEKQINIEKARKTGVKIHLCPTVDEVKKLFLEAEIVVINWWNHPLMSDFLYHFPKIETRLIGWMHVNGCKYPYLTYDFLNQFDYVFFTSMYSYENEFLLKEEMDALRVKSSVILGNGDFTPEQMKHKLDYSPKKTFTLGYVGTLDYSKMHKNYIGYCEAAIKSGLDLKIILVGDIGKDLEKDIKNSIVKDFVEIKGYVEDVESLYLSFDALGYILNENNYGTTENVILEAMAYGLPVIAFDSGVERNIIDHNKNGFLIHSAEEFVSCIYKLVKDENLQSEIGNMARKKVCEYFSSNQNICNLFNEYGKISTQSKKIHSFIKILGDSPFEWFLKFTGVDSEIFVDYLESHDSHKLLNLCNQNPIFLAEKKSSIRHFAEYHPNDLKLNRIVEAIKKADSSGE